MNVLKEITTPLPPSTYLPEGNPGVQRSTESHPYKKEKKKNVSNVLKEEINQPNRNLPSKIVPKEIRKIKEAIPAKKKRER